MSVDRTSSMGLFPHDPSHGDYTDRRSPGELLEVARDPAQSEGDRDAAIWLLGHRQERGIRDSLLEITTSAESVALRRSASWVLFKTEAAASEDMAVLDEMRAADDSLNLTSWKNHLVAEARGETGEVLAGPVRRLEDQPFDVSMPLLVEGQVQFKDSEGRWYRFSVGSNVRGRMVGDLVAYLKNESLTEALVMQKTIQDFDGSGRDFIEGYKFRGFSRPIGDGRMVHYYESLWEHELFLSGRTGDDSAGTVPGVRTHLLRTAETDIASGETGLFPQSVRGIFYGSVFANEGALLDRSADKTGAVQILSRSDVEAFPHVNGVFFGTFRGVPVDVDDDGVIEINGIPPHVDGEGGVIERTPSSRHYSDVFSIFRSTSS